MYQVTVYAGTDPLTARLGHGPGATTLRHYADPVSEVDGRAAADLAPLTAPAACVVAAPQAERHPEVPLLLRTRRHDDLP